MCVVGGLSSCTILLSVHARLRLHTIRSPHTCTSIYQCMLDLCKANKITHCCLWLLPATPLCLYASTPIQLVINNTGGPSSASEPPCIFCYFVCMHVCTCVPICSYDKFSPTTQVDLALQLDSLFRRSLHKLALDLARAHNADAPTLASIQQK
jgi:hypothetical protein